tara:strand:+ start:156 stop:515 length:360 start_codon:yes stop_codon:yes gene_type:complete
MLNFVLLVVIFLVLFFSNNEYFTCSDVPSIYDYTYNLLDEKSEQIPMKEFDNDPITLIYNGKYSICDDIKKNQDINDMPYDLKTEIPNHFRGKNPLNASDIFYNETKKCPNSSPIFYKF